MNSRMDTDPEYAAKIRGLLAGGPHLTDEGRKYLADIFKRTPSNRTDPGAVAGADDDVDA